MFKNSWPALLICLFFDYLTSTDKRNGVCSSGSVSYTFDDRLIYLRFRFPLNNVIGTPSATGIGLGDMQIGRCHWLQYYRLFNVTFDKIPIGVFYEESAPTLAESLALPANGRLCDDVTDKKEVQAIIDELVL